MDLSDENLMARVKAGQLVHAALLFERYQQRIYHYFLRSLGNVADAQDAAQSTFVRMLSFRQSYQPGKKFSTWLISIAVNQRNQLLGKRSTVETQALPDEDIAVDLRCPTDAVGRAQFQQRVQEALGRLNPDQRDLLSLYLWEERGYVELSEIYQTKVATLRVRVHRALSALQRQIKLSGA